MLLKLSKAPALLPMPILEECPPIELPTWDEFKPTLQPVPEEARYPELILPPFRKPGLEVCSALELNQLFVGYFDPDILFFR